MRRVMRRVISVEKGQCPIKDIKHETKECENLTNATYSTNGERSQERSFNKLCVCVCVCASTYLLISRLGLYIKTIFYQILHRI